MVSEQRNRALNILRVNLNIQVARLLFNHFFYHNARYRIAFFHRIFTGRYRRNKVVGFKNNE